MLARLGVVSTVASPITVEGRLWGAVIVSSIEELPADTEERLEKFTELVATAVANAESRSELAASRRRIVAASDETRRQIERDLHDGTQQRLVSLGLAVRAAEANLPPERDDLRAELSGVATGLGSGGRRSAGDLPRDPSGDPLQGRARPGIADTCPPVCVPVDLEHHRRYAARGADRSGGLLRRLRGSCERGEAFAGVAYRRLARAVRRQPGAVGRATTAWAAPMPAAGRVSSASPTASRRSVGRSRLSAHRAAAPHSPSTCLRRPSSSFAPRNAITSKARR